jgi:TPR repeat protein
MFMASCTALLSPSLARIHARQPADITWERAVDAYLEGELPLAVRVLEIASDAIRRQADDTFERWVKNAFRTSGLTGAADRRTTVRRLQGSAALAVEILLPLSSVGGYAKDLRVLEGIAAYALEHAEQFEDIEFVPEDRAGRPAEAVRRALAQFRARWHVAFLQALVNQQRRRDVLTVSGRIKLPPDDTRALAEMRFLMGLLDESVVRFNTPSRPDGIVPDDVSVARPSSSMLSVGKRYDKASDWYRQALAARPDHIEARLHLGRLAVEGGRHAQVLELLAPLDVPAVDPQSRGLARLFMAESHAARGARDAAQRGYEQAARIVEVRQSALVALTLMAMRDGQLTGAADLTKAFDVSDAPASDDADAWTAYVSGRRANSDAVLDLVREALLP